VLSSGLKFKVPGSGFEVPGTGFKDLGPLCLLAAGLSAAGWKHPAKHRGATNQFSILNTKSFAFKLYPCPRRAGFVLVFFSSIYPDPKG